jgi:hypothetical protein
MACRQVAAHQNIASFPSEVYILAPREASHVESPTPYRCFGIIPQFCIRSSHPITVKVSYECERVHVTDPVTHGAVAS